MGIVGYRSMTMLAKSDHAGTVGTPQDILAHKSLLYRVQKIIQALYIILGFVSVSLQYVMSADFTPCQVLNCNGHNNINAR